ncbi:hypothetical protein IW140_000886 [Coemansia sp. RSA 1813]|nr:hypothetical protein EV178_001395 [Coemansia sp. RSA 1646]KAJ1770645.1 hypothetical protein LPJ74_003020 [Coemansia sp. RSA 1843]KAJ2093427.1 hypothetical protein IW138_000277 [Coemansia sp. RSA 986]KAJ2217235.1 hypothetical protein EV179_000702 [Coemansia sp. RSA 487]KAJ2572435.1 hypothetical protein IW140_000886 [Coemansia sp. RSA 1813]
MKLQALATLAAVLATSAHAATANDNSISTSGLQSTTCISSSETGDQYQTKSDVKHATLFTIEYKSTYKVLNNLSTNNTYVLYQCGSTKPDVADAQAYIQVPVSKTASWSTSVNIFIQALGVQNTLQNLGTASSVVSPCLQELLEEVIKPFNDANETAADAQELANDVVFNMVDGEDDNTNNTVISSEYLESSVLGRTEWLKFFAAFFNAEERANTLFDQIESNYECLTTKATTEYNDIRPVVAWTSYAAPTEFNNNTAYWQISFADYKYDIVRDAGARMLNTTGPQATIFSTAQAFLDALEDVDIVIDESFVSYSYKDLLGNYGISNPTADSSYSWVSTGRVFRPDRIQSTAGGLAWFETPIVFADALLQDLIGVAHPKFIDAGYKHIWFRNMAANDSVSVVTASNCTDMYAQLADPAQQCSSLEFQSANPSDAAYSGVDENQTQDLIYDISKSEVINGDDGNSAGGSSSSAAPAQLIASYSHVSVIVSLVLAAAGTALLSA